jgi:hypothetical protein
VGQVPHGIRGGYELRPHLAELIVPNFEFAKVGDVADVTELDCSCLTDLVHV